jgi:hypothetical protein
MEVIQTHEDRERGLEQCPSLSAMPMKSKSWAQRGI